MRPIKFRAWYKGEKFPFDPQNVEDYEKPRMVFDVQDAYDGAGFKDKYGGLGYISSFGGFMDEEDFVVMQYTGENDVNGKEVFEKDVCRLWGEEPYLGSSIATDYDWQLIGAVVEYGGCFWLRVDDYRKIDIPLFEYYEGVFDIEVIGNIYENPELLEQHHD